MKENAILIGAIVLGMSSTSLYANTDAVKVYGAAKLSLDGIDDGKKVNPVFLQTLRALD